VIDPVCEPPPIQRRPKFVNDFEAPHAVRVLHLHVRMTVRDLIMTFGLLVVMAFAACNHLH